MMGNLTLLTNFMEKFLGTVKFGNDQIAPILGYGDLVQGAITIKRVYYVEGLNHNLFSVGQFCDADLEVAFGKSPCYIHDLKGNDLLTASSFPYSASAAQELLRYILQSADQCGNLVVVLDWKQTEMATKIEAQDLEISSLKARIKLFEDKDKGTAELSGDDAPIKERSMKIGEGARVEKSTERGSNDTEELVNILTSMDAVNILTSGVQAVSVPPVAEVSTIGVPTSSGLVPTVSVIFTTASVVTPYSRRPKEISAKDKGKEKIVESDTPKKKKLQE
nr:integrase, catalytic region, zinc finger, CCHC-type, peptidase aspartic, catalytic [Tanacetum cinerariifolium]